MPVGVPGELLIGGAGVADGYLGRPELTAERFVDPASGRLGRASTAPATVARRPADGTLEFLGRTDNQVKLRGHRIELGEIEAVLDAHPGVRQAVVAVRGRPAGGLRRTGRDPPAAGARSTSCAEHAGRELPGYMVPAFVALDACR